MVQVPSKIFRASLVMFALTLSVLASGYPVGATECTAPDDRYVSRGECCFFGQRAVLYHQVCVNGFWLDDGSSICSSHCLM